jgi:nucleoside-triphosphatase THEP1
MQPRVVLLTGAPGVGKTTAIQRVIALLRQGGPAAGQCELRGFVTREVRGAGGQREGFEAVLCSTGRAVLMAHESKVSDHTGRLPRVSKYVIDVPTFESAVLPELQRPSATGQVKTHLRVLLLCLTIMCVPCTTCNVQDSSIVYVLDEIGKMECYSSAFKKRVSELLAYHASSGGGEQLGGPRRVHIIGTIPLKSQDRFIEGVKARSDVELLTVTQQNRDAIPDQLLSLLGGTTK